MAKMNGETNGSWDEYEARENAAEYLAGAAAADTHSSDVEPKSEPVEEKVDRMFNEIHSERAKPKVKLVGRDGNAFAILGACTKAARKAGWKPEVIKSVMAEMTAGDYSHLLATAMKHFDVS